MVTEPAVVPVTVMLATPAMALTDARPETSPVPVSANITLMCWRDRCGAIVLPTPVLNRRRQHAAWCLHARLAAELLSAILLARARNDVECDGVAGSGCHLAPPETCRRRRDGDRARALPLPVMGQCGDTR